MARRDPTKIEQCLFGYADGHRLLATSLRLEDEIASDLTALSDIVPGVRFARSEGYWTGFPVPDLGRYGLMRTWPALEMPRPGCVWSHLLLFSPTLFEAIDDLSTLEALTRRPSGPGDRVRYSQSIAYPPLEAPNYSASYKFNRARVGEALEALYGGLKGPLVIHAPGELDGLVFAVWSQQWPKLRRNFRFQTAATAQIENVSQRFDLQLRLEPASKRDVTSDWEDEAWLRVAADDLALFDSSVGSSEATGLRSFFQRYGTDVKRQRGSFRPLAQLYAFELSSARVANEDVPAYVVRWFPELDDALKLKQDLIDGIVLPRLQIDGIVYLCEVDVGRSLPAPSEAGLKRLAEQWPERAFDLMRLAEWAATRQGALPDAMLSTVSRVVPVAEFWRATDSFPEMRRRMVATEPDLLDDNAISALEPTALLSLIEAVPKGHDLGTVLVDRLPAPVDRRIVAKALERYPLTVLSASIEKANLAGPEACRDWLAGASKIPSIVLDPTIMERVRRASIVVAIAEALNWDSNEVIKHGLRPWKAALTSARDEDHLSLTDRDRLEAFFFTLAISTGEKEAEDLLERSFGYLHDRLLNSYLPWAALKLLEPRLPSLGWTRDWDKGLKLRLAVTQAYVDFGLAPESFGRLLDDKRQRKMLRKAAEEIDGAERYVNILRD